MKKLIHKVSLLVTLLVVTIATEPAFAMRAFGDGEQYKHLKPYIFALSVMAIIIFIFILVGKYGKKGK